jgi:hypothetical protein
MVVASLPGGKADPSAKHTAAVIMNGWADGWNFWGEKFSRFNIIKYRYKK